MKNVSHSLHELIHSMTKAEKRYFKLYVRRFTSDNQSIYERLFDVLDTTSEYDEQALLEKYADEAFTHRFSIVKNRLYQTVTKSLDAYHSAGNVDIQLKRQIHIVDILYRKGLYNQAVRALRSVKKQAEKHQRVTSLIEISNWEKKLIEDRQYEGLKKGDLKKIRQSDDALVSLVREYNELWVVKSKIFKTLYQKGKARSAKDMSKLRALIKDTPIPNENSPFNTRNRFLYNHLNSAFYFATGEDEKSYPYLLKNLEIIDSNWSQYAEEPKVILSTLVNLIHVGEKLENEPLLEEHLTRLQGLPKKLRRSDEDFKIKVFTHSTGFELARYLRRKDYPGGFRFVKEIESQLAEYDRLLSDGRKAVFYFNFAVLYYQAGHLNEALKWITQLINFLDIDETLDIHCMARIIHLIIHLDLGNESLLPNIQRNTHRFLSKKERVYAFETIFLNFLTQLQKPSRKTPDNELYESLFQQLKELREDPYERRIFEFFDFLSWAEKKRKEAVGKL